MSAPTARYPQGPQGLPPRTLSLKQAMFCLCYVGGHFLLDCPRLPAEVRRAAAANRGAYLQQSPRGGPSKIGYTRFLAPHPFPRRAGNVPGQSHVHGLEMPHSVGQVVHAVEQMIPDEKGLEEDEVALIRRKTPWAEIKNEYPAQDSER
jgi:hypothetical protein